MNITPRRPNHGVSIGKFQFYCVALLFVSDSNLPDIKLLSVPGFAFALCR